MFKFLLNLFRGKQVSTKTKRFVKATLARSGSVSKSNDITLKRSYIIELDSMLSLVLNDLYGKDSIKDNLIKAKSRFNSSEYQNLWNAHKVRNRIVHEPDGVFNSKELDVSVTNFVAVLSRYK